MKERLNDALYGLERGRGLSMTVDWKRLAWRFAADAMASVHIILGYGLVNQNIVISGFTAIGAGIWASYTVRREVEKRLSIKIPYLVTAVIYTALVYTSYYFCTI